VRSTIPKSGKVLFRLRVKCLLVQQDPVERRVHHLDNWKLEVYFTGIGRYNMAVPTNLSPQSHSGFCAKFKDVLSGDNT
jgi:hypothetical protein